MKSKLFNLRPPSSPCNLNYLEISVKGKWLISENQILIFNFVRWPNFTIVDYNPKISIIYHQIKIYRDLKNRSSIKKLFLKIFQYSQKNTSVGVSFLNKNADLQSWDFIKKRLSWEYCKIFKSTCFGEHLWIFESFPTWASNITSNMGTEEDIFSKTKQGNWRGHFLKNKKFTFSWCSWSFRFSLSPLHALGGVCPTK